MIESFFWLPLLAGQSATGGAEGPGIFTETVVVTDVFLGPVGQLLKLGDDFGVLGGDVG